MLHTPIIKCIFEIYLGTICIAVGKSRKENMEGLKTVQLSTVVVTLLYSTLKFQVFQYFSISVVFEVIFGASMQHQDTTKYLWDSLLDNVC